MVAKLQGSPTVYKITERAHQRSVYILGTCHEEIKTEGTEAFNKINSAFEKFLDPINPATVYIEGHFQASRSITIDADGTEKLLYDQLKNKKVLFKGLDLKTAELYHSRILLFFGIPFLAPVSAQFMDQHPTISKIIMRSCFVLSKVAEVAAVAALSFSLTLSWPWFLLVSCVSYGLFHLIGSGISAAFSYFMKSFSEKQKTQHYIHQLEFLPYNKTEYFFKNLISLHDHRNQRWVQESIIPALQKNKNGPCLFAIGAAHLRSPAKERPQGVIDILERDNRFSIESITLRP